MANVLPGLSYKKLGATRDSLQDVCKVMSKLQQAFLPKSPRDWHYGLEVTLRGISTQAFEINGQPIRALLDLVRHKLRLGNESLTLRETPPAQIFESIQSWLREQGSDIQLDEPTFTAGIIEYDTEQADAYAQTLWWFERRFEALKDGINNGVTSPVLLYPHHFDLSLVWFSSDDKRHLAIGWSTGDETIAEPYVYLTAYPDPEKIKSMRLPPEAHWQSEGFSAAIMLYGALQKNTNPEKLINTFARSLLLSE